MIVNVYPLTVSVDQELGSSSVVFVFLSRKGLLHFEGGCLRRSNCWPGQQLSEGARECVSQMGEQYT